MNRSFMMKITVIFMLFILFTGTVHAFPWSNFFGSDDSNISEKLKEIELKSESLTENKRVMKFINYNMFDQGVDTVEISIKNENQVLKKYYLVRAEDVKGTASFTESVPDHTGVLWKFKPTVDQALDGLDQASEGLFILDKRDRSTLDVATRVMKALYLYLTVEKENVPSLNVIIEKSRCARCKKALSWAGL